MKQIALKRLAVFIASAAIAASACGKDSTPTSPNVASKTTQGNDTASTPVNPNPTPQPPPPDTGLNNPPPIPTSVALTVHIGRSTSSTDTLQSSPIQGATATVYQVTWQFSGHVGPDSLVAVETQLGTGSTDANGDVTFTGIPQAGLRIQADPPSGSGLGSVSVRIAPYYTATVRVPIILRAP